VRRHLAPKSSRLLHSSAASSTDGLGLEGDDCDKVAPVDHRNHQPLTAGPSEEAFLASLPVAFAGPANPPSPTPSHLVAASSIPSAVASAEGPHISFVAHHRTEEIGGGGPFRARQTLGVADGAVVDDAAVAPPDAAREAD